MTFTADVTIQNFGTEKGDRHPGAHPALWRHGRQRDGPGPGRNPEPARRRSAGARFPVGRLSRPRRRAQPRRRPSRCRCARTPTRPRQFKPQVVFQTVKLITLSSIVMSSRKRVVILGSTGSIGESALKVARDLPRPDGSRRPRRGPFRQVAAGAGAGIQAARGRALRDGGTGLDPRPASRRHGLSRRRGGTDRAGHDGRGRHGARLHRRHGGPRARAGGDPREQGHWPWPARKSSSWRARK